MTPEARIAKFRRRAPSITSQQHLDKIVASFDPADRKLACEGVAGVLPAKLVAREDVKVELKPQIAGQPNATEATVIRLNAQAAELVAKQSEIDRLTKENASLVNDLAAEKAKGKG